ncbi:MAG: sodium:solute symporter family protein [Myxococcales bacterium]|nr:sodium:solute symporter family protein [Myxococcales bacterium]USN51396.1 MAG: sodium:solute symporter family protein [Myxococcales bacterium]
MINSFHSSIDIVSFLSGWDFLVLLVFAGTFLFSPKLISCFKKQKNSNNEFLLMSRDLGLALFVATLTSTWYGGIFGVTQIAFEKGLYSFFTQGLSWYSAYLIFALFIAKKIRKSNARSLPELIGMRFGLHARKLSALILFFHALPVTYALSIGILIQILTGLSLSLSVFFGVLLVTIYSLFGGLRAIVITDALQFLLMFISVMMVVLYSFYSFGGLGFLETQLPNHYFDWHGNQNPLDVLLWFLVACSTTLIHPVFYQRCLAAKNDSTAFFGILCAIILWIVFDCCTTLGGMYAKAIIPQSPSEQAYLYYGVQLLPAGLRGFFIAGLMAVILSTLDSFLFVSGTSISYDFLSANNDSLMNHRIMIGISGVVVIGIALLFGTNFEALWLFMEATFSVVLFFPVMATLFSSTSYSQRFFFAGAITSFASYALISMTAHKSEHSFLAFFLAHLVNVICLLLGLYMRAKSKTKLAVFPN